MKIFLADLVHNHHAGDNQISGSEDFVLTIDPVNDPPSFDFIDDGDIIFQKRLNKFSRLDVSILPFYLMIFQLNYQLKINIFFHLFPKHKPM